jgi:hypothetical protein
MEQDEEVPIKPNRTDIVFDYFHTTQYAFQCEGMMEDMMEDNIFKRMCVARLKKAEEHLDKLEKDHPFLLRIIDIMNEKD